MSPSADGVATLISFLTFARGDLGLKLCKTKALRIQAYPELHQRNITGQNELFRDGTRPSYGLLRLLMFESIGTFLIK